MTTDQEPRSVEENMARLLAAALGGQAQIDPVLRQQVFDRLLSELRAQSVPSPFPDAIIALLSGVLACAATGLLLLATAGYLPDTADPVFLLLSAGVALNLILVPFAGATIVIGRQRE